jgi:TIR domain
VADVFVSYAAEDRDRAAKLSTALIELGWSVWWDRRIIAGQSFDQVIEQELDAAKSVVVLWSKHSIESEWVKNEAAAAAERDVLVPAAIDKVRLPLEFRRRQTADLTRWKGESAHGGFHALCEGVASKIGCELPLKLAVPFPDAAPGTAAPATIRGDFGSSPDARSAVGRIRVNRRVIGLAALASVIAVVIATLLYGEKTREFEQPPVFAPPPTPVDATRGETAPTVKGSLGSDTTPATTIAGPAKTEPAGRSQPKGTLATATPKVDPPKPSASDCRLEALQRLQRGEVTTQKYQELVAQCR